MKVKIIYNTDKEEIYEVDNYEELDELVKWIGVFRIKNKIILEEE